MHIAVVSEGAEVKVVSGKRAMTLKASDLTHYIGERGRRGNKLPRGLQRVDAVEVLLTSATDPDTTTNVTDKAD